MANFTVIEGGGSGPPENEAVDAGRVFRMMIVEVLRALARGDDPEERIASLLVDFTRHASSMKTPLPSVVADVISELHEEVVREGPRDYGEGGIQDIIRTALAVAGEIFTDDGFASMRIERKMSGLRFRMEQHLIEREKMAREHGQSYLVRLIKREFPKERKPRPGGEKPPTGPGRRRK